ncbi:MAG: nucleotidyl transferase AbiEii/AbiGii toxin family protein [Bacteroidota bacterium]|nr:nucleotidyl transferase AbiEii/AbiGii toxin family protein [Bacteroidota bacterium]
MNIDFITNETKTVFELLAKEKFLNDYTLVGGTALSVQIQHRLLEDLDFIYDGEFLNSNTIKKFIDKKFKGNYKIIKQDDDHQLDFLIKGIKVTFFTTGSVMFPFILKENSVKYKETNIATVEIISVMKLNALTQRNTIRDYYDLYYIAKNILPLKNIFQLSKKLLSNISEITYTETIVYVDDIRDESISNHLKPKDLINKFEISDFFTNEIKNYLKQ